MEFTLFEGIMNTFIERALLILIILVITFVTARMIRLLMEKWVRRSSKLIKVDETHYSFMKHFISALVYIIGISIAVYTIPSLRTLSVSIFAGAGVLAVIIGFASQQAFSNIVSGIFIVLFKPFRVGDKIKIGTDMPGKVEDITLRHTIIKTWENKRVVIPNSIISNEKIENWDLGDAKICKWVEIGISYDSNIDKAIKIMQQEAMQHPDFIDNRTKEEKADKKPAVAVKVISFGDSSVNLRAYVWAEDAEKAFIMGCDLNKSIKESFDKEGIEIPFPYRTLVYKNEMKRK